jgi:GNAT superfamily N-acetyltransferase
MSQPFLFEAVVAMEHAAARAWPALRVERVAGWHVRLSGGGSRRANSVLPLDYDGSSVDAAIDRVEALYRGQGTRAYFQVSSASGPAELDAHLAERGYTYEEPCLLMAKALSSPLAMPADVEVATNAGDEWLSVYTEPLEPGRRSAAPAVLAAVPTPRAFLLLKREHRPVASALCVLSPAGVALVECVATVSAERRSGAARVIMDALESWATTAGARAAVLQVVATNTPATTLYVRRGYAEAGRYHYRWKAPST